MRKLAGAVLSPSACWASRLRLVDADRLIHEASDMGVGLDPDCGVREEDVVTAEDGGTQ